MRAADYSGRAEWFAEANADVAVLLMVEGEGGVRELPEILETPTLDGIFLGPMDLSHALGVPGEMGHLRVVETIEGVIDACRAKAMTTGIFAGSTEAARRWFGRGVTLVAAGVDTQHFLAGLKRIVTEVRG